MATDVVMPQMGESVAEGTIVRWIKKVGDQVARDEPLFEISTDKVDAEIPSPAAGIVDEIRVHEGETVPVHSVVAVIRQAAEQATLMASDVGALPVQAPPVEPTPPSEGPAPVMSAVPGVRDTTEATEARIRRRSSPLVRKIASDHNVDISTIQGTGISGRVTKRDILEYVARDSGVVTTPVVAQSPIGPEPTSAGDRIEAMSVMRRRIADHMVLSRRTSAHVHTVFEVNFQRVSQAREAGRVEYERAGVKLTYLSFIMKAVVDALRAVPVVNASIDRANIVFHKDVNLGVAVALDWGLIVPVIKKADALDLLGLSRAVTDLAARARSKQLKPDEVTGGTFTITNPGVFGTLFGMPIINQPQVAILGVGSIEKRPVVVDDAIAIRSMAYLTLGYDHRLIDGAVADQFMSHVKQQIENWPAQ